MSDKREYKCGPLTVIAPSRACLFCDRCSDVFWDYTHGPYMFFCDAGMDTSVGAEGRCEGFVEEDE